MIVREFEHNQNMPFDCFNDYKDTKAYLRLRRSKCKESEIENIDSAIAKLEVLWQAYLKKIGCK